MKTSIIIPTRNRTKYLNKLIINLEKQTKDPYEVIFIVHKSDLKSKLFFEKLDTNLNLKYSETDGGSCKARNEGINKASGDILIFIEDDVFIEKNYIKNTINIFKNYDIDVITGYTFDLVDLTTPWLVKKSEVELICNNKNKKFFKMILDQISKSNPNYCLEFNKNYKKLIFSLIRNVRNFFKMLILHEWPKKGIILPSGYRSEMPSIDKLNGLKKVEWVASGNFAVRKNVINKFRFNENLEILPYALAEDLELSARIGKEYEIFSSPDLKLFHSRSISGVKINQRQRFKSMVINFHRISKIRGNKFAYWWSVVGILISRLLILPFSYKTAISEIKGIIDGISYLENLNE